MDCANFHLARHLAGLAPVELITHRLEDSLAAQESVRCNTIPRPFGRVLFGAGRLRAAGERASARILQLGGRFVANGGNCNAHDINWVHYVHAAYKPQQVASTLMRAKSVLNHRRSLQRERDAISLARYVVANSEVTADHIEQRLGVPRERIKTVYYGSDPQRFAPTDGKRRAAARAELQADSRPWLVFVGALGDRRKGFDTLYDAWRVLAKDPAWDAVLVVVGHGAEAPLWKKRAEAEGLAGSIRFLGFRNDVPRVLAAAEGIVHPARYEAYGLGVHEAVCTGLPAIVTANCGVTERLRQKGVASIDDIILPQAGDSKRLGEAIRQWRAELETWPERVRPVADRLRRYTWDDMASDFFAAVQRPVGGEA
ncbi:MAG: glycosyltransferase family 4 protein [Planctomycetota bacterium]